MKTKILRILRNSPDYVSGQELCNKLGVSRTAIWKVIGQLKEEGYRIEATQNKGYKIETYPDVVTANELGSVLTTTWIGNDIRYYDVTDSTNAAAKLLAEEGAPHGVLVVSDMQSGGKGRRGKSWSMSPGTAIAMSVILRPNVEPANASMLTIVMGLSVAQGCMQILDVNPLIKWPNDIIVNKRKICGILTEMSTQLECINYLVIGVGINTNVSEFPQELNEIATSLLIETGAPVKRSSLINEVMTCFEINYEKFIQNQDLSLLMDDYNNLLVNNGESIKVLDSKGEYKGTSQGINSLGELIVQKEDGQLVNVYSGEVSVRGLYGYA